MRRFFSDESGAVTVDWVVITAAIVGLGLATMAVVSAGTEDLTRDTSTRMQGDDIMLTSFAPSYGEFAFGDYQRMDPTHHVGNWTHLMTTIGGMNDTQISDLMTVGADLAANGTTPQIQAWGVDVYSAGYGQMQARDMDVSGQTHPQELIDTWQADYGA